MEVEAILSRLVQNGTVTDVDIPKRRARVKFHDTGHTSGWLYVLQHYGVGIHIEPDGEHSHETGTEPDHNHTGSYGTYWLPKVNDNVVVLYLPVKDGDGFILGGII